MEPPGPGRPELSRLAERLRRGGEIDDELVHLASTCARLFKNDPLARLLWIGELRRAARHACANAYLWEVIEPLFRNPDA